MSTRTNIMGLIAACFLALGLGRPLRDTSAATLRDQLIAGDCEALPLLAAHHPETLTQEFIRSLAAHTNPRLRELIAHPAWIPHISLQAQAELVRTLEPAPLRRRATLWLARRPTSQRTLTTADIASYWADYTP